MKNSWSISASVVVALFALSFLSASAQASDESGLCRVTEHAGRWVMIGYTWTSQSTEIPNVTETECREAARVRVGGELECTVAWGGSDPVESTLPCRVNRVTWKFITEDTVSKGTVRSR